MALARLLTIEEVAEILRLAKPTLYRFVSLRKIPFVKIGGRVLFDSEKLSSWIAARAVDPEPSNGRPRR